MLFDKSGRIDENGWLEIVRKFSKERKSDPYGNPEDCFEHVKFVNGEYKRLDDIVGIKIISDTILKHHDQMLTNPDMYGKRHYVFINTKSDPKFWCGLSRKSAEIMLKNKYF